MRLNNAYLLLSIYGIVAGATALLIAPHDPRYQLLAAGQLALPALLALPSLMSRPIRLHDPLNLVVLALLVGTVTGSYMLGFGDSPRRSMVMAEWDVEVYAQGGIYMLISLVLISLGYCMTPYRVALERVVPRADHISDTGLRIGLFIGAVISLLALASFIQSSGGLANVGGKRAVELNVDGQIVYAASGYARLLANISSALLLMVLGFYLWRDTRLNSLTLAILTLVFMLSLLLPILTSGRQAMVQLLIGILFVTAAYRDISVKAISIALVFALVLFSVMTTLRTNAQGGGTQIYSSNPLVKVAESGNGLAIASTTAIIHNVPERMPYQLGSTMLSWVFAPIPRSVWPSKPDISLGKRIKGEIYQQRVLKTGRPVSVMTEGYLNFGWVGFLTISLAFGALLRVTANSFEPVLALTPFAPALYFYFATTITEMTNASLSQGVVRLLSDTATFLIAWALMRYIVAHHPRAPAPVSRVPVSQAPVSQGPHGLHPAE